MFPATRPEPNPDCRLCNTQTALPSPSATQKQVVSSSRSGEPGPTSGLTRPGFDPAGALAGVLLVEKAGQRHVDPVRVGHELLAVGEGQPLGLDHDVDAFRRQAAHPLEVELLDEVQLLEQHVAARVRRHLEDSVPVVVDVDRLLPARLECRQVGGGDQAAVLAAEGGDLLRDGPFVEGGAALLGDTAQGGPEVPLDEKFPGFERPAARLEQKAGERIGGKPFVLFGEHGCELLADGESALAQVDRRGEHLGETQPSEALVRLEPAVDEAGD